MAANTKDVVAGLVFIGIGLLFGLGALDLPVGTAFRMGPGYFPLVLCALMIVLGVATALRAVGKPSQPFGPVPWRGILLVVPVTALFGFSVRGLGLIPAVFMVAFVSALASKRMTLPFALGLATALSLFCAAVFVFGLGLPIRLFGPWVGG